MPVYKLGIIGAGPIFRGMHFPVLRKMQSMFRISKIYDSNPAAYSPAMKLFKESGYEYENSIFVNSANDILSDKSIDAVCVLTGINSHVKYTLAALEAGKHVFLEKPAALSVKEISKMNLVSSRKKKMVQVGMVLRHSRWYKKLEEISLGGKYGKVLWMHWLETRPFDPMNWRYDTHNKNGDAVIHDKAIHQVNLFNALSGSKPQKVMAMAGQYLLSRTKTNKLRAFSKEVPLKGDSNDHLMTVIKYKNGVKADLLVSYVSPHARESRWVIQLEKAKIVTHFETFVEGSGGKFAFGSNPSAIYVFKDDSNYSVPWRIPMSYPPGRKNLVFYDEYKNDAMHPGATGQWKAFYESLSKNEKPLCSLSLAGEDTKIIEAIVKSVKHEQAVLVK